jgi:hypothetical protein
MGIDANAEHGIPHKPGGPSLVLPAAMGLLVSHGERLESLDNGTRDRGSTDVKQSHMRVAFTCNVCGQWPAPSIPKSILMFVQV